MSDEREYVLGTGDDELERLGFQHGVWSGYATRAWEAAGFGPGQRLLDVGCGPGHATFDLARLVGRDGHVHGIDLSERFVAHLRAQAEARGVGNVTAEVGDLAAGGLPDATYDGAYARWVLCFVPDAEAVVRAVARTLRPGAAFVVQDYSQYSAVQLAPEPPVFIRVREAVVAAWRGSGGNPSVGAALPALMERCGLRVRHIRPISRIARPGTALWKWPKSFFDNFLPGLVAAGTLDAATLAEFNAAWAELEGVPGALFVTPPMVEIVAVRE
ncbi:MAG TPA: methyltransferase domain-containing protein [Longimicrobium sp.]|nr:methyltransferase domain-containing protein [Longimicrobium sp.]